MLNHWLSIRAPQLKGLAILGIIYYHVLRFLYGLRYDVQWMFDPSFPAYLLEQLLTSPLHALTAWLEHFGYLGVSWFFLLSGWGLAYSLQRRQAQAPHWVPFMRARLRRILPLYWIALLLVLVLFGAAFLWLGKLPLLEALLLDTLIKANFLHPYLESHLFTNNASLWFVAVIVPLYALFPWLYRALRRRPNVTLLASLTLSYLLSLLLPHTALGAANPYLAMGAFPLTRLGEFALGAWLAMRRGTTPTNAAHTPSQSRRRHYTLLCLLFFALGCLGYQIEWLYPLHPLLLSSSLLGLLYRYWPAAAAHQSNAFSSSLAHIGRSSYALYLFHCPPIIVLLPLLEKIHSPLVAATLYTIGIVGAVLLTGAITRRIGFTR